MNHDQQTSHRRHLVLNEDMNAHSQADQPPLLYVMQFNAAEKEWDIRQLEMAKALGVSQQQTERIHHLPHTPSSTSSPSDRYRACSARR